jgi:ATP-binding cassette subfamily F protein 3
VLLRIHNLKKQIAGRTLFSEASLQVKAGDRIGLVGPNGAGKSTLLRIAAGEEVADEGEVAVPRQVRVAMLRQEIDPSLDRSVREEAASALEELDRLESQLRELESAIEQAGRDGGQIPSELADRYDRTHTAYELGGGFERDARVSTVLAGLGFDEARCARPLSSFSGGWLMRVELAKLLLANPDVLLLDEPTNHLDLPAIQWFEEELASFRGAVLVVSHDRTFLRRHVDRVAEIDGHGRFTVYEGNYDRFLTQRDERQEELLARKANQDREIAQMERFVERFRAKASKAKQAQSRIKALDKIERIEVASDATRRMRLRIPPPQRSGEVALRLNDIHKSYGAEHIYAGVDFEAKRGDRIALVGPNGAGKSTLLRIAAGVLDFDRGERTPGHNVQTAFFAQHQLESLSPTRTVLEELGADALTEDVPRLRGHLGAFLFTGDDVEKKVAVLSGGEKARLALAKMLLRPANLLILDEPTNHLDIPACEVLEGALGSFAGTLLLVSHDRSFINALATRVVEILPGRVTEYIGNYDDYLRKLDAQNAPAPAKARAGEARAKPQPDAAGAEKAPAPEAPPAKPGKAARAARQRDRERRKARDKGARRIAQLEAEIQTHESQLEQLAWKLGDPEVFRDGDRVRALEAERTQLQSQIDELYQEWERRQTEVEALDDAPK